jgi:Fe-S oxidoreductase
MNAGQRNLIRDGALDILCESQPDVLVTACPLCKKTFESGNRIMVKDIAEIVAESISTTGKKTESPKLSQVPES